MKRKEFISGAAMLSGLLVRASIQHNITLKFKRNTNNGGKDNCHLMILPSLR